MNSMSFRRALIAASAAALALVASAPVVTPAHADPLGEIAGEVLDIAAKKLQVDVERGTALLEGDVKAVLGELTVTAPKVQIRYDEAPRVKWARAYGGVQATVKGIRANAAQVEVNLAERRVDLSGGVRLSRGKGWVKAERASIDLGTHKVTLHGVEGSIPVKPPKR